MPKAKSKSLQIEQNKSLFIISTVMIGLFAIIGVATTVSSNNNEIYNSSVTSDEVINDLEYFKGK